MATQNSRNKAEEASHSHEAPLKRSVTTGRAGTMSIVWKDEKTRDVTRRYFEHPIWETKWGDPIPDMPLDIQLELINTCNLSCTACTVHYQKRRRSMLTWDILQSIVDQSVDEGVCYLTICGMGEASLHPDLFKLLRYARDRKVAVKNLRSIPMLPSVLVSNGMWTEDQVAECIENPPDLLSLSLAGLTPQEIRDRRSPIDVDQFYRTVKRIYEGRKITRDFDGGISPVIHISTHIYPQEVGSRGEDIRAFKEKWLSVSDAVVIKPTNLDSHHRNFGDFLIPHLSGAKPPANLTYTNISAHHYERTAPCMETSRRLSVDSGGNVWCGHELSEVLGVYLGNVYKETLREIWHGEEMNAFRRNTRAGRFPYPGCALCGTEIREPVRDPAPDLERSIQLGGWGEKDSRNKGAGSLFG